MHVRFKAFATLGQGVRFARSLGIASAIGALSVACAQPGDVFGNKFLSLGTSTRSGIYHVAGEALCDAVNQGRQTSLVRCVAYNSIGSDYNAKAVANGELAMGITHPDIAAADFSDTHSVDKRGADLRAVMSLHAKPIVIIVRRSAGIASVDQLAGHSINLGNRGSGQRQVVDQVMRALALTPASFSATTEFPTTAMGEAFCQGKLDIIIESLGNWTPFYKTMIEQCGGVMLSLSPKMRTAMLAQNPFMQAMTIPPGVYAGQTEAVTTVGLRALLVTNAKVSTEAVYRFTASVMERLDAIKGADRAFADLDSQHMFYTGIPIPLHPGVIRYLEETKTASGSPHANTR